MKAPGAVLTVGNPVCTWVVAGVGVDASRETESDAARRDCPHRSEHRPVRLLTIDLSDLAEHARRVDRSDA